MYVYMILWIDGVLLSLYTQSILILKERKCSCVCTINETFRNKLSARHGKVSMAHALQTQPRYLQ